MISVVSAYRLFCLTKALCVRFITKRFIGEYDHKKGKALSLCEQGYPLRPSVQPNDISCLCFANQK